MKRILLVLAVSLSAACSTSVPEPVVSVSPSVDTSWQRVLDDEMTGFYQALADYGDILDRHFALSQEKFPFCFENLEGDGYVAAVNGEIEIRDECFGPYSAERAAFDLKWWNKRIHALKVIQSHHERLAPLLSSLGEDRLNVAFTYYVTEDSIKDFVDIVPQWLSEEIAEKEEIATCDALATEDERERCSKNLSAQPVGAQPSAWQQSGPITQWLADYYLLNSVPENTVWD